jgi:hypothetical protein
MNVKPSAAPIDFDQARTSAWTTGAKAFPVPSDWISDLSWSSLTLLLLLEGNAIDYRIFDDVAMSLPP